MSTNKQIHDELMNVETKFNDKKIEGVNLSTFASFLSDQKFLPSSSVIEKDFEEALSGKAVSDENKALNSANVERMYGFNAEFKDIYSGKDKTPNEFGNDSNSEFNNKFMFLALNQAFRPDKNDMTGWINFHNRDGKHDSAMLKFRLEINDLDYYGCYITDIFKNVVDSNSGKVMKSPVADENSEEFKNCANILAQEISIVKPEKIIVLGGDAFDSLKKMAKLDIFGDNTEVVKNATLATHYSDPNTPKYITWFNKKRPALMDRIAEK